jgi:arylsulfatase A-like enzyme
VSTAEKLPQSNGLAGGYLADGATPGPLLARALDYINGKVGVFKATLKARHLDRNTTIVLSAKHAQSPQTPSALTRIKDSTIFDALNAKWAVDYPKKTQPLAAFAINDDGWLMWLNDRSQFAADYSKTFLWTYSGTGNDINGNHKAFVHAGLDTIYAGAAAAAFMNVTTGDSRVPDVIGIAHYGTVYTGGKGKIAEHGGNNLQDRAVPLVVSGGRIDGGSVNNSLVETTQIAPTILALLDLNPWALKSVRIEHTKVLPLDD